MKWVFKLSIPSNIIWGSNWENLKHIELQSNLPACLLKKECIVSSKISKSIDILYKSREVSSKQCLKQLYFSFIHNYLNYVNTAWASTSKCKLERFYYCQIHAARVIYHKDWYTHVNSLLKDMKVLSVFRLNIFGNGKIVSKHGPYC